MSDRRSFLALLGLGLLLPAEPSRAQQGKVFRIGHLNHKIPKRYDDILVATLQNLGYEEGKNLQIQRAFGTAQELPSLALNLVRANVDVIMCAGSAAVRAAMSATRKIPVVAVDFETDPVARGYATSLSHPGGNLTGIFLDLPEFSAKRLEILNETLPGLTRVATVYDPALDRGPVNSVRGAAQALHLTVILIEVPDGSMLETAFKAATKQNAGVIIFMHSPGLDAYKDRTLQLAAKYRMPLMVLFASFVVDGALLSYGPNVEDLTARMCVYVDKIFKGAKPGDLPIERPTRFDFFVNVRTAKSLGLSLPQSILTRADEVIH